MKLTLTFEDGTFREIVLKKAIEINLTGEHKQSLEFRETKSGEWIMSFTKSLFGDKKIRQIEASK